MLRQPTKQDKMYMVEVDINNAMLIWADTCVYAQNPKDALVFALKKRGYAVSRNNIISYENNKNIKGKIARVSLLGGTRESQTYYRIINIQ